MFAHLHRLARYLKQAPTAAHGFLHTALKLLRVGMDGP